MWFGERWINSIFDLFEENVRYFPALLPVLEDEDPLEVLESGRTPSLAELRLHNGTIYRWNRPVYDVVDGTPHLRVENRVLPAGPTVVGHHGERRVLLRAGAHARRARAAAVVADVVQRRRGELPRRGQGRHRRARCTGPASARCPPPSSSYAGCCRWRGPGLDAWGVQSEESDRLLGIIEQRCIAGQNGASWFAGRFAARVTDNDGDRLDALRSTLNEYREHMHTNEPVHTWE